MGLELINGEIAILGGGQMGGAVLTGLLNAGFPASRLRVSDPQKAADLAEQYGVKAATGLEAVKGAQVVIVAVKPYLVADVLGEVASGIGDETLIISLAAGIAIDPIIAAVQNATGAPGAPAVVRVMPNTAAKVGEAMTGVVPGPGVTEQQTDMALAIFNSIGKTVVVTEAQLDVVGTLSGSGPAYLFLVAESMIEAGVRLGLPRDIATELMTQTMVGSAKLLATTGIHPAVLREQVTSPGGTTAAAVFTLEDYRIRAAFSAAMKANLDRTAELG
jgi:pyrroline-5-carboxylate reductase